MKYHFSCFFITLFLLCATSCASKFEEIRTSNDPKLQYDKAFEYFEEGEYVKARTLYELLLNTLRGKDQSEKVYFYYARTFYEMRNYRDAVGYFENFTQTFINSEYKEEAEYLIALANYKLSPSFRLDQTFTRTAMDELQLFINKYPNHEKVEECNNLIDELQTKLEDKAFDQGKQYQDRKMWQAAKRAFNNLIKDYPDSKYIEQARFMIAESEFLIAENSIVYLQEERYGDAIKAAEFFKKKYPISTYTTDIDKFIKTSQEKLKQFIK